MGMFDHVKYECSCPVCHNKVSDFQSKDGECLLDELEPFQVDYFYGTCGKCGCRLEFEVEKKRNADFVLSVYGKGWEKFDQYTRKIHIQEPT